MKKTATHSISEESRQRARKLRKEATFYERALWNQLRKKSSVNGFAFRRQHPLDHFIVDFVCLAAKLIVELDGQFHDFQIQKDRARDDYLMRHGYKILRFSNRDVKNNIEGVVTVIKQNLPNEVE